MVFITWGLDPDCLDHGVTYSPLLIHGPVDILDWDGLG